MITKKQKNWEELISDMQRVDAMSCRPTFARFPNNFITDENKSVKWNREQVVKNHDTYDKEVARLNTEKNKERDKVLQDIYRKIQQEVRLIPDTKHAKAFYQVAQNFAHINSGYEKKIPFENIIHRLKEECEFYKQIEYMFREIDKKSEEMERE